MLYQVREIRLVDREIDEKEVLTQIAAAELLGVTVQGVQSAVERGRLTLVVDPKAHSQQGRRLVLRSEVMVYKRKRRKRS